MKHLNFLSTIGKAPLESSSSDIGRRYRVVTDFLPSFCRVNMLKFVSILTLFLIIGAGNVCGAITNNNNGTYTEPSGTGTAGTGTITWSFAGGNITVVQSATGGNAPGNYLEAARIYRYNTLSCTANNGFKIEKVEIICSSTKYGANIGAGSSMSGNSVTGTSDVTSDVAYTSGHTHSFTPTTAGAKTQMYIKNANTGTDNVQIQWASGGLKVTYSYTAPTAVAAGTITSSSFGLSITDALNTNKYDVYFNTTGTAPTATTTPSAASQTTKTPTISSGVSAGTTYYVWARSVKAISSDTWKSDWKALTGSTLTTESAVSCTSEITITKGTPSHGSFSMTGAGTVCIDEGNASVTISDIEPASGYRFKEITSSGGGTINNNAKTVSNISATTTINVVFETIPSHKAYFYNGTTLLNAGGTSFQEGTAVSYSGSTPTTCDTGEGASTTFAGWATDVWEGKVAKNDIEPDFYESTLPVMGDEDVTYYAVFCKAGEAGSPTDKFSVNLQVANGNLAAPSGYTLTHASEWKNSSYRQDGSNDPAYVSIYHTSTKLFTTVPSTITVKAELAGGSARDPLNNSVYAVFLDNSGNEIDGSATVLCTSVTTSYVEKTANMPTSKAADAYGIKIRHAKESSYNVRYKSLTLSYATAGASTNYMTTCCNELGQINGSLFRSHLWYKMSL